MLEFLPDRKMERVCQTIMKRIIFARGVPDELRSDNAPELMQGIVRLVCQYLDITQVVTGGLSVNQSGVVGLAQAQCR